MLDPQMSLDPPEEQLDAPPHLVKHGYGRGPKTREFYMSKKLLDSASRVQLNAPKA